MAKPGSEEATRRVSTRMYFVGSLPVAHLYTQSKGGKTWLFLVMPTMSYAVASVEEADQAVVKALKGAPPVTPALAPENVGYRIVFDVAGAVRIDAADNRMADTVGFP